MTLRATFYHMAARIGPTGCTVCDGAVSWLALQPTRRYVVACASVYDYRRKVVPLACPRTLYGTKRDPLAQLAARRNWAVLNERCLYSQRL